MRHAMVTFLAFGALSCARDGSMRSGHSEPAADSKVQSRMLLADQIQWKDGPAALPAGAQMAVLEGDPSKEGFFVFRGKMPDGYKVPPHWHPVAERITVL